MLGTFGVGKTSLVQRFVNNLFNESYKSTVGVQVLQKSVSLSNGDHLNLILWDLANIEKMSTVIENYFRGSAAAIVVFDVSRAVSFELQQIHLEVFMRINPQAAIFFAANKVDLLEDNASIPAALLTIAAQYDGRLISTSAKLDLGVPELFDHIAQKLGS